jgi:hypothetical protein
MELYNLDEEDVKRARRRIRMPGSFRNFLSVPFVTTVNKLSTRYLRKERSMPKRDQQHPAKGVTSYGTV